MEAHRQHPRSLEPQQEIGAAIVSLGFIVLYRATQESNKLRRS